MRPLILMTAFSIVAGGCASRPIARTSADRSELSHDTLFLFDEAALASNHTAAAALVFRPPVADYAPPIDFSRDLREPSAFIGFEEGVSESYYVRTDDRQVFGGWVYPRSRGSSSWGYSGSNDRYERRAIIEKTGLLRR
jgi:hypothetical protein